MSVVLDWTGSQHWGGGKAKPCHVCGDPALLLDDAGRPAHKVCVEALLAELDASTGG